MKLLVVSQYFWPEPFRINDICAGLKARGWDIDVLTSLPNVPEGRFYDGYGWFKRGERRHEGVGVERVGVIQRGKRNPVRWAFNCASFAVNSLFHLPHLNKNGYDAVFVFNNSPITKLLPANAFARHNRIPNVVYLLDIWPDSMFLLLGMKEAAGREGLFRRAVRGVCRRLYRGADLMLISSEGFEGRLREMGLKMPVAYLPNFAEPFEPAKGLVTRESLGVGEGTRLIGFAGNVGPAQGLSGLVEAAGLVRGRDVSYLIVGDGPELPALKAEVERKGLAGRFVFVGRVEPREVPEYIALCDAALVPLKDSGVLNLTVPAKLQTYMYAGKPVVAFLNGAGAELVKRAGCGFTAAAGDSAALARAIEEVCDAPREELARMGAAARAFCLENFEREALLDRLDGYLKKAVEDYGRRR